METTLAPFVFAVLLLCCYGTDGKVKIFRDFKFKGLIYDEQSWNGVGCHNVQPYAKGIAGSMKTDSCLIVYENERCTGNSFKISRDMTDELEELGKPVSSYHACNDEYGGDRIHVDLMNSAGDIIAKYGDICGCQDLPSQVSTRLEKLNNYGNCISVYSSDHCGVGKVEIPAGQNRESQNLPELGFYVRSISACGARPSCVRLHGEIIKFELMLDESRLLTMKQKEVTLATKTTFFNNGSATVFQEYEARRKVVNSVAVEKSKTISKFSSKDVSKSLHVGVSVGVRDTASGLSVSGSAALALQQAYGNKDTEEETEGTVETHTETKEFSAKQIIEVPPCVEYEVSSTVETVEDFPLTYEMYTKVTGESSGRRMTADELAIHVDDMIFVEVMDEYTAVYKSAHSLQTSAGVETKISGEGSEIPGCLEKWRRENLT